MNILDYINKLTAISPRFAQGEVQTAEFIKKHLDGIKIEYTDHTFPTSVPYAKEIFLEVDGERLDCRNVGMESGEFTNKDNLISSVYWSDTDFYLPPNINFNPRCKDTVSMALYYKHAAIAVRRSDINKILNGNKIYGKTVVEPYEFTGHNFLIGNLNNPKNVIFTHYDCWENGAIDNASGTAVTLHTAMNHPELHADNLFVIAGNEEISYDEPIYWGRGYRAFQEDYKNTLDQATNILVVDCVGYSENEWATDPEHVVLGIPFKDFDNYTGKTRMLCGDFDMLMDVYHSDDDTVSLLSEDKLNDAQKQLITFLQQIKYS